MDIKNLKSYLSLKCAKCALIALNDIALLICGFIFEKNVLTYLMAIAVCILLTIVMLEGRRRQLQLDARHIPVLKQDRVDWLIQILLWVMVVSVFAAFTSDIDVPDTIVFSSVLIALFTGSEIPYYRYTRTLCKGDPLIPDCDSSNSFEF